MKFWLLFLSLFSIFLFFSVVSGQKKNPTSQELNVWRQRVDDLTEGIIKDSASVDDCERGTYLALLAKKWWAIDPPEARRYANKAIDLTVKSIDSDDDKNLNTKLKFFQKTAQIIATLDEILSQTLAEKVAKILEKKGNNGDSNADSLVMIGLQVIEKNPRLAFALGVKSLTFGNSLQLNILISELNSKDSNLAESLFRLSLVAARGNYTYEFTGGLGIIVFEVRNGRAFSDSARSEYLNMLAEMISKAATVESERATGCEVAALITPILDKFDQYLQGQSLTMRQQVQVCLSYLHPYTAETAKAEASGDEPQTSDEYIQAARDTNDKGLKSHYFYKAIKKLELNKNFDEIISLLDNMTEDEVKAVGNVAWDSWRSEYAYQSTLVYFENKDMPSVYRIISRTPKRNRPYVRFRLIYKLSPLNDRDFILENLEETRKEVGSVEIPPKVSADNYLALSRLYAKILPTEAEALIREAVKYINKADGDNPNNIPEKDFSPLQDEVRLPFELLATDESSIYTSLANISSKRSRIRLKLGLLESSLQKWVEVKKKADLESRMQKK